MLSAETLDAYRQLSAIGRGEIRSDEQPGSSNRPGEYARLIRNLWDDTLSSAYPVTYALVENTHWHFWVDEFLGHFPVSTHFLWQMADEFRHFLMEEKPSGTENYPFLSNLLDFEWIEIELFNAPDQTRLLKWNEELKRDKPILANPEIKLMVFDYPVHLPEPETWTERKGSWFVAGCRNPDDFQIYFTGISPAAALCLEQVQQCPLTLFELTGWLRQTTQTEIQVHTIFTLLENLQKNSLILGTEL